MEVGEPSPVPQVSKPAIGEVLEVGSKDILETNMTVRDPSFNVEMS